jgi:3-phenylpropionate/trans-cinnamate dioxygenase ferredoxin reductase subunit
VLALDSNGGQHRAHTAVVAIGMVPATGLAESAGLEVDNGVVVDEHCRTSDPAVYAVGDVANHFAPLLGRHVRVEHWQHAQHQAASAARNMMGMEEAFAEVPWVWSDQYEINLQIAGQPHPDDEVVVRGDVAAFDFSAFLLREGELVAAIGANRPGDVRVGRQWIATASRPSREVLIDEGVDLEALAADAVVPA